MTDMLAAARELTPLLRSRAGQAEQNRDLTDDEVGALRGLGVFRLAAPRAAGGREADPLELIDVVEELGYADGSAGWVAMIGAATSVALGRLDQSLAAEMLTDPDFCLVGVAAPGGRAVAAPGGYRVSGRWPFASGCRHATWLAAGVLVDTGSTPDARIAILPPAELTVHDTWHVSGLKATGSHDLEATDVLVPPDRLFSLTAPPNADGLLYRFPVLSLLALGIGAVALGIARAAIEALSELAGSKRNPATGQWLAEKPATRIALAGAEALRAGGLSYLRSQVAEMTGHTREAAASTTQRAALRLAIMTATRNAARAVDLAYDAGGGSSIRENNPLQRCFRDVHVATQHAMVGSDVEELIGAVLLDPNMPAPRL